MRRGRAQDATKGIQTQTAECLVIGEILMDDIIVVLNKALLAVPRDWCMRARVRSPGRAQKHTCWERGCG